MIICDECEIERATDVLYLDDGTKLNLCDACYFNKYHEEDNTMKELNNYTIPEIHAMIDRGEITKDYPVWYYNNEWWDEEPETEYDEAYIRRQT